MPSSLSRPWGRQLAADSAQLFNGRPLWILSSGNLISNKVAQPGQRINFKIWILILAQSGAYLQAANMRGSDSLNSA
jgi:hypothetical protein